MPTPLGPALLVLCLLVPSVAAQRWAGTYKWDNKCKVAYCCCYTGELTVRQSGSNLIFSSETRGCGGSQMSSTFSNPGAYSFAATGTRGSQIVYSLSPDSNTLSVRNTEYNQCGGSAARTSAGTHTYASVLSLGIMLAAVWFVL